MANDKFLFVVSGAAGTGKDSVVKALREAHPEIEKTVSGKALEHVIEKAKTGKNVTSSISIKIQSNINICFFCSTTYFRFPFSGKKEFGNFIPIFRDKGTYLFQTFAGSSSTF